MHEPNLRRRQEIAVQYGTSLRIIIERPREIGGSITARLIRFDTPSPCFVTLWNVTHFWWPFAASSINS
jgi:hypothetical protein